MSMIEEVTISATTDAYAFIDMIKSIVKYGELYRINCSIVHVSEIATPVNLDPRKPYNEEDNF